MIMLRKMNNKENYLILDYIPLMTEEEIYPNKIEVTEISIVSRTIADRPYYSIKYTKADTGEKFEGYSSYKFKNVMHWKRMYFKLVRGKENDMGRCESEYRECDCDLCCEFCENICEYVCEKVLDEDEDSGDYCACFEYDD